VAVDRERLVIVRNYDAAIVRWFDCVARRSHRFNAAGLCMDCGAERRGPTVVVRSGGYTKGAKK
jgi:hypothetical protein